MVFWFTASVDASWRTLGSLSSSLSRPVTIWYLIWSMICLYMGVAEDGSILIKIVFAP
jgi:hypothetical protein